MSGMIKPVEWKETYVKVLDQTLLPEEVKFMEIRDAQVMWMLLKCFVSEVHLRLGLLQVMASQ